MLILEDVKCIGRLGVIGCDISDMFFMPWFQATSKVTSKGEVTFSCIDQMAGCLRQGYKEHVHYITSNNPHSVSHFTFSKINTHMDPSILLCLYYTQHIRVDEWRLENLYIQPFQQCDTIITEQSYKDNNPHLMCLIQNSPTHAHDLHTPLSFVARFQCRVVCHTSNINTPWLGMYFTDSHFISVFSSFSTLSTSSSFSSTKMLHGFWSSAPVHSWLFSL